MEEIKALYKELRSIEKKRARESLWIEIIEKNRSLLKKRMEKVQRLMKRRIKDFAQLTNHLASKVKEMNN
ncbi:MAG: hypothetical protein ACOC4M_05280 [Promethearchaeia archaeon]